MNIEIKWHDIDPDTGQRRYLCAERFAGVWKFRWKLQRRGEWTRGLEPTRAMWEHVLDALERRWREQAAPVRKNSAADVLLRVLPSTPIITVSTAAQLTGRTFQAADMAVARLTDAGVLRQIKLGRRNRAFEAVGLVDTLTSIERQLASPDRNTRVSAPIRRVSQRHSGARAVRRRLAGGGPVCGRRGRGRDRHGRVRERARDRARPRARGC